MKIDRFSDHFIWTENKKGREEGIENTYFKDFRLNMEELVSSIENNSHHVLTVEYQADSNLRVDIPGGWQNLNL